MSAAATSEAIATCRPDLRYVTARSRKMRGLGRDFRHVPPQRGAPATRSSAMSPTAPATIAAMRSTPANSPANSAVAAASISNADLAAPSVGIDHEGWWRDVTSGA